MTSNEDVSLQGYCFFDELYHPKFDVCTLKLSLIIQMQMTAPC